MGWIRNKARQIADRRNRQRRPDLESLEIRTLLSIATVPPLTTTPIVASYPSISPSAGTDFDSIVGATAARGEYHVDGFGETAAVIDAGVNYDNSALGDGFGAGHKVIAGYDIADGTADPIATGMQHGTSVAGLIASEDSNDLGIAPGADIVALKVYDNSNQATFQNVATALQWVITNHAQYNITVVNLSMSDGNNYAANWYANDGGIGEQITSLIGQLDALNIPVVTAAGNSYAGSEGMGFPAIVSDTISVTSTDENDQLVSDAQRLGATIGGTSATDIAAPGYNVEAPADGDNLDLVSGTSFAAPMVSGAILLMQQVYESRFGQLPTVAQLDTWLKAGANQVTDSSTGFSIGVLNIPSAIAQMPSPAQEVISGGDSKTTTSPSTTTTTPTLPTSTTTATPPPPTTTTTTITSVTGAAAGTIGTTSSSWSNGTTILYLNGEQISDSDLTNTSSGSLAGLPSYLISALESLSQWGSGAKTSSIVQVWTANDSETVSPAGKVIKTDVNTASNPTVKIKTHTTTKAHDATAHTMTRAWHIFGASRRSR